MKNTLRNTLIALVTFSSPAFAAGSSSASGGGLLLSFDHCLSTGSSNDHVDRSSQRAVRT